MRSFTIVVFATFILSACGSEEVGTLDSGTAADGSSRAALCAQFCAGVMRVCPSDDACPHSCESEAPTAPSQAAIDCATNATTCAETGVCWDMLGL
ncbi:MAG: hypothetical protein IPK60_04940 [Sandaracinaceae bacterium]|nr:hypothetical protein [Sandaracinaceae bacterium]